ncbi:MAG: lytic transglycosylase domain-containing protein [Pararhodobacter sp.]|nr:lytic transglycosylase domain-containing protein [Pararhodobacter sp.]
MRLAIVAALSALLAISACGRSAPDRATPTGLYPGETPELRRMIRRSAAEHGIPEALLHRVIQRESDYRPAARNGPYWGMMQILPQTARTMGFRGQPEELLDPEVNLRYAGRYLRGAWMVSDRNIDRAVMWYARGYYYEARERCMLVATGLARREVARHCR